MKQTIHHLLLAALTTLALTGCYDDDKVWDAIDNQQMRLDALEKWQTIANGNIQALQVLLSGQDYITNIAPVTLDGQTIGYTIAFHTHAPVTIYNGTNGPQGNPGEQGSQGKPGTDGAIPIVNVAQQEDGNWYWTLNGELLTDADGNPIRVNGHNGQSGTDGTPGADGTPGTPGTPGQDGAPGNAAPVPMLKTGKLLKDEGVTPTDENLPDWTPEAVYLSVDGGTTWKLVSGTLGIDNDACFKSVVPQEEYVTFTLSNGGVIKVPRYVEFGLDLAIVDNNNDLWPIDNLYETILCHYDNLKLKCTFRGTESISSDVYVMARMIPNSGDWRVDTRQLPSRTEYYIALRCSSVHPNVLFTLLITAIDNAGHSRTYDLSIQQTYD